MEAVIIDLDEDLVRPVLADVHHRWRDYVDLDDLWQEAAAWWYGRGQKHLAEYLDDDDNHVRLRRSVWRYVAAYAQKEKAAKVGYLPLDQYRYPPAEVASLLPIALNPDGVPEPGHANDGPKAHGNLAESGDMLAGLVDVRRAVEALAEDDVHFLVLLDDVRQDYDRAGELLAVQPDSVRRRYQRIIERMCRWLNNEENYQ